MSPRLIRSRSEPEPQMSHTDSDCHPETLIYDCKPETLIYPSLNTLISKVAISFFPSCPFSPACALFSGFSFACALPHLGLLSFSPANRTNVGLLLSSPHSFWHSRLLLSSYIVCAGACADACKEQVCHTKDSREGHRQI
jgi:hypothetical protein